MISLSTQQKNEVDQMQKRTKLIQQEVYSNLPFSLRLVQKYHRELIEFKIRLEELCDETDATEEKLVILQGLTFIEHLLTRSLSDDYARYVDMALHIDPKNGEFLGKKAMWLDAQQSPSLADKNYDHLELIMFGNWRKLVVIFIKVQ